MAKKNKQRATAPVSYFNDNEKVTVDSHSATQQWYPVPVPECANMDDLAAMSDEELNSKSYALHADRNKVIDRGIDAKLWDIELAYVYREFQLRRTRRDVHERFMRDQARQFAEEEARLPSAEFDNLRYVMVS